MVSSPKIIGDSLLRHPTTRRALTASRVIVVALTFLVLGTYAQGALTSVQDGLAVLSGSRTSAEYLRIETLREEFSATIPPSSRVAIVGESPDGPWVTQRISEIATMYGVIMTSTLSDADYFVSVVEVSDEVAIGGYHLVIEQVRTVQP